jgi:XTP/dITP diphosphohydrolase
LTIYWPNKKLIHSVGKIQGYISNKLKGKNGFGYDPIFMPLNKKITFGEMKPKEKYKIDHRYNAFKKIKKFF